MKFVLGLIFSILALNVGAKTIKGKVIDGAGNEPLIGATVMVEGTSKGTATNIDGEFEIDCAVGSKLVFSYISYDTVTLSAADGMEVVLQPSQQSLNEVTVVAQTRRDVDTALLNQMKTSLTDDSGVSAQQIERRHDKDASEGMRRVPGISVIEDKFIMVRGLSQRYNNVWINGSAVPSSEADTRAFSFDIVPASQIDNITIVKAPAPEYPADFCGGFIKVNTKNIPENNSFVVSVGGTINEKTHFRKFLSSKGSATDFLGFDNGFRNFNGGIDGVLQKSNAGVNLSGNGFNNDWTISDSKPVSDFSLSAHINRSQFYLRFPIRECRTLRLCKPNRVLPLPDMRCAVLQSYASLVPTRWYCIRQSRPNSETTVHTRWNFSYGKTATTCAFGQTMLAHPLRLQTHSISRKA